MQNLSIKIKPISQYKTLKNEDSFAICLLNEAVFSIVIDNEVYLNESNSIYFLHPKLTWEINKKTMENLMVMYSILLRKF